MLGQLMPGTRALEGCAYQQRALHGRFEGNDVARNSTRPQRECINGGCR
jgi:hypothetical protein